MSTTITIELVAVPCASCGVIFGLTQGHEKQLRNSGAEFFCPNGHSLFFRNNLEEQIKKLKNELKQEEQEREYWRKSYKAEEEDHKATKNQLRGTKAALTKTKKRISNGVCPCCNRHFTQLERHMKSKHPDYQNESGQ